MPLPFRLDHINLWLLDDGPGWTVVDTGIGLEETRALWERVFAETLDGRPLTRVVVTHFHPDHMGNAGWLTERWRAALWCTQAEWLYAPWAWPSRDAATCACHASCCCRRSPPSARRRVAARAGGGGDRCAACPAAPRAPSSPPRCRASSPRPRCSGRRAARPSPSCATRRGSSG